MTRSSGPEGGEGRWEAVGGKGEENGGGGREGRRKWRLGEVREDKGKRETERDKRYRGKVPLFARQYRSG